VKLNVTMCKICFKCLVEYMRIFVSVWEVMLNVMNQFDAVSQVCLPISLM
jgi:hypothetical protein